MQTTLTLALVLVTAQASTAVHPADRVRLINTQVLSDLLMNDLDVLLARELPTSPGVDEVIKRLSLCLRAGRRT
jgi:hypothetical protein